MIPILLSAALAASAPACIADIHDGDSVRLCPDRTGRSERVRIMNIDAPELPGSPRCRRAARDPRIDCDAARARKARDELARILASGPVTLRRHGTDAYGRTLATLRVGGQDVGTMLVAVGLARRWR